MSVIYNHLEKLDEKEGKSSAPWRTAAGASKGGALSFDLPQEILSDFYDLREYIRIAGMRGQMRVLSITSSVSGEGSSTIATFLAFLMAKGLEKKFEKTVMQTSKEATADAKTGEKDKKEAEKMFQEEFASYLQKEEGKGEPGAKAAESGILLIDGNLHQPSLHKYFGLNVEDGLAEIVEGHADWHRLAKNVRQSDLKIITAGRVRGNPADVIASDTLRLLLKQWRQEFRYVIIDSPAVLNFVDALTLAAMADGVILVVRAGATRWEIAQSAKRKLVMAHANLLGVALNRHKLTIPDNYYQRLV
ncbi:CpsD/CapB family tyrosine-protein kinase [candidate division KSB1 bacterium]|nr:CpsD/CapB family tyrosine-protein kinase [candidate division KSB1 bacterium]